MTDPDLLERLRRYDTPTLANSLGGLTDRPQNEGFTRPPVHSIFPSMPPMVGYAVTLTIRSETPHTSTDPAAPMAPLYEAVQQVPGPRIVVVQDLDCGAGCLWGEVNSSICLALGCEGVVTDGLVRDLPDVEALGFRYLARGVGVARAYVEVVDTGIPVEVGGVRFTSGDLVHADRHGALVIPHDAAEALPAAAEVTIAKERRMLDWVRSADFDPADIPARRIQH
ncbi:MAG TPA: RraA family protein [Aquihabitans sp.]|jgi:regulator of RNase E activity RraA|nr:RraA family protein [Aquihabitans sp.]